MYPLPPSFYDESEVDFGYPSKEEIKGTFPLPFHTHFFFFFYSTHALVQDSRTPNLYLQYIQFRAQKENLQNQDLALQQAIS